MIFKKMKQNLPATRGMRATATNRKILILNLILVKCSGGLESVQKSSEGCERALQQNNNVGL